MSPERKGKNFELYARIEKICECSVGEVELFSILSSREAGGRQINPTFHRRHFNEPRLLLILLHSIHKSEERALRVFENFLLFGRNNIHSNAWCPYHIIWFSLFFSVSGSKGFLPTFSFYCRKFLFPLEEIDTIFLISNFIALDIIDKLWPI